MRNVFLRAASAVIVLALIVSAAPAGAQVSLTAIGTPYTQNFDSLSSVVATGVAWTDNSTIPGWYSTRTTYNVATGSSNSGALYSYGVAGTNPVTDRALGGQASGTTGTFFWAARFVNNTASTITSLDVSFMGEQWRDGGAAVPAAQTMVFQYQVGATGANAPTTGWTGVGALDFASPTFANLTTGAALDGNAPANRTAKTSTITGLSVAPGQEIWIRWQDLNDAGNDHGLAIDDLSVTPQAAVVLPSITINDVTQAEGNAATSNVTFTVTLSAPALADVTFDVATADGTATAGSDYTAIPTTQYTILAGTTTKTIDVSVNGDMTIEPDETFFVNLSNVSANATIADNQGLGTITNDDSPNLSINDVTLAEGDAGTTTFSFTVQLSQPAGPGGVTFDIATADGTATQPSDYTQKSLTSQTIPAGSSTYTFDVLVNGDTTFEPNETFFVNVTNVSGAAVTDGQGLGTITNDDYTKVHSIQGSAATSSLNGSSVTTRGIVTALRSNGFYLQAPDSEAAAEGDPTTSEGIFVFTSSAPTVAVGNDVTLTGTVSEYIPTADIGQRPLTELTGPSGIVVNAASVTLPAPIVITPADTQVNNLENLEKYEGMRVSIPSLTVIAPTQGSVTESSATSTSNGVFYGVVTGVSRPFREAGIQAFDSLPIPTIPQFDLNPERIRVNVKGLVGGPAQFDVASGMVLTNLLGVLHYDFRTWTFLPEPASLPAQASMTLPAPTPVADPTVFEFTVANANLQRFFDTANDPSTSDPILTATAFANRLNKASLAIRNYLKFPDVLAVQEMENLTTLQTLASKISADALLASQPDPLYVPYLTEGNDVGGIDVGFLVKTAPVVGATPRVTVNSVVQENALETFANPDLSTALLNDRPPLRLMATINHSNGSSFSVTVIDVHQRSLSGVDDPAPGTNGWTTEGDRVRAKRKAQAESLANLIQARQVADATERIVVLGDFNAFEVNDGYVDAMGTVIGTPTPAGQAVLTSADLVNPDLTLLDNTAPADQRYSYSFDGNAQALDHILINQALVTSTSTRRIEHARINSDYPEGALTRNDSTVPMRISDHDPGVAFFTVATFPVELLRFAAE